MSNKKQLFENVGGNSFRIATPQAMGMMAEDGEMPAGDIADFENGRPMVNTPTKKVRLTIARKPETNEWLVKVYINGKYSEDSTYYTDDQKDAIDTAKLMMQQYRQQGFTVVDKKGQPITPT